MINKVISPKNAEMPKTIQLKTKRGFLINAFENDSITEEIQHQGEYDANTLESLTDVLAKVQPRISLDVGANIGNHALVISGLTKKLIAFEPILFIYRLLSENIEQNHIHNVDLQNLALSNENKQVDIFVPDNNNLGSSSIEIKDGEGIKSLITAVRGDDFLHKNYPNEIVDFIKMDVEGHEASAIMGLKETIQHSQPLLLLEWKSQNAKDKFQREKLFQTIFAGYKFYALTYTANKKVYPRTLMGYFRRLFSRLLGSIWCLTEFSPGRSYSNVYFVPRRYQELFESFKYLDSKGKF